MQTEQDNQDGNYYAHRRLIRDTTPDRTRRALRNVRSERMRAVITMLVMAALVAIGAFLGRAMAAETTPDHDPVLQRKITDCADYVGTVNYRLQDGRAYEVARILVTASKEAGNGWGWELLAAIARYETGEKFNPKVRNAHGCYGLLQIHDSDHFANMRKAGLNPPDPYDTVLWGAIMLATSHRKGKSLWDALEPWDVRRQAIKEYENIKELYRR